MTIVETKNRSRTSRIGYRLGVVLLSVVAATIVWFIATLAGAEFAVTSPLAGTMSIDLTLLIATVLPIALAAWGVLALLERFTPRAKSIWTIAAVVVLGLSLPPLALLGATVGTTVALVLMHLVTGLILILGLRRGARSRVE